MSGEQQLVFVYGTLKKGEPNEAWMANRARGEATYVGTGKTQVCYPLVISSKYNIPFLIDLPSKGNQIHGEIYKIDKDKLSHLDELEDYPRLYGRRAEKINTENGECVEALMYFLKTHTPEMLDLPYLSDYRSGGSHGKPYKAEAIISGVSAPKDHHPADLFATIGKQ